jgi:hypothetical protein
MSPRDEDAMSLDISSSPLDCWIVHAFAGRASILALQTTPPSSSLHYTRAGNEVASNLVESEVHESCRITPKIG